MSTSRTKDCFIAIGLHPVPKNVSIDEFAAKMEALADAHLALPVAQRNFLKYELMIPHNQLDHFWSSLGFPKSERVVLVKIECETSDHCAEFLRDETVANSILGAHEFAGVSMLSADVATRIDASGKSTEEADLCTYIIILKATSHKDGLQLYERVAKDSDRFVELPFVKKNFTEHTTVRTYGLTLSLRHAIYQWTQNAALADEVSALGIQAAQPLLVLRVQAPSDLMTEAFADIDFRQFFADMTASDGFKQSDPTLAQRFAVDVITKLDREA
ncbi:hypothetical protein C8R47DRAFT_1169143 [Mycena vitilis]|nr:hypothetical protein C8R47DRAFT_1169143 [Mycena vitilis]